MADLYRPQKKFAKVMFLQVSVCPQGGMHAMHAPWAHMPPRHARPLSMHVKPGHAHPWHAQPPGHAYPQTCKPHRHAHPTQGCMTSSHPSG